MEKLSAIKLLAFPVYRASHDNVASRSVEPGVVRSYHPEKPHVLSKSFHWTTFSIHPCSSDRESFTDQVTFYDVKANIMNNGPALDLRLCQQARAFQPLPSTGNLSQSPVLMRLDTEPLRSI
jgi:hypothetical protein